MNKYAVILAGGNGSRFWPVSRENRPKQFVNFGSRGILINDTITRVKSYFGYNNIFIVTSYKQVENIHRHVDKNIFDENIIIEPYGKNTAACIAYAATYILKHFEDGIMCIFPSDHYIKEDDEFIKDIDIVINSVMMNISIGTIGIKPSFPATGYGYLNYSEQITENIFTVKQFIEKPKIEKAIEYINCGGYAWNSGIYICKISNLLDEYKKNLPLMYAEFNKFYLAKGREDEKKVLEEIYYNVESISIDFGVMEKCKNIIGILSNITWSDLGTWDSIMQINEQDENGNVLIGGECVVIETSNCIISSHERLIATLGVKNLVIVETEDVVLVCDKNESQKIGKIVECLKNNGMKHFI